MPSYADLQKMQLPGLRSLFQMSVSFIKKQWLLSKYQQDIETLTRERPELNPLDIVLYQASCLGNIGDVQWALSLGADVDYKEPYHGKTSLMQAAIGDEAELVRVLLMAGADPNIETNHASEYRQIAALWAAFFGNAECVRLITQSPRFDVALHSNHPSCHYWINRFNPSAPSDLSTSYLIQAGVILDNAGVRYVDPTQPQGWCADIPNAEVFYWALQNGKLETVKTLLGQGMRVDSRPDYPYFKSPLTVAAEHGQLECCRLLVTHGAKLNLLETELPHMNCRFPIFAAATHRHWDVVEYLAAKGADTSYLRGLFLNHDENEAFRQSVERGLSQWNQQVRLTLALGRHPRVGELSPLRVDMANSDIFDRNCLLMVSGFLPGAPERLQNHVLSHEVSFPRLEDEEEKSSVKFKKS